MSFFCFRTWSRIPCCIKLSWLKSHWAVGSISFFYSTCFTQKRKKIKANQQKPRQKIGHVSLVSSALQRFLNLTLSFMNLTLLILFGQLFCRNIAHIDFTWWFSWSDRGYTIWARIRQKGSPSQCVISRGAECQHTLLLMAAVNLGDLEVMSANIFYSKDTMFPFAINKHLLVERYFIIWIILLLKLWPACYRIRSWILPILVLTAAFD